MKHKKHILSLILRFLGTAFIGLIATAFWGALGILYFLGVLLWIWSEEKIYKIKRKIKKPFSKYFSYERGGVAF